MKKPPNKYVHGFSKPDNSKMTLSGSLSEELVNTLSKSKGEPRWMREIRLKALRHFLKIPMPSWGVDLSGIDLDKIVYYKKPTDKQYTSWEDLPVSIKDTYDRIGVPQAERDFLSGVTAQYDSEVVYKKLKHDLTKQGVVFLDMDSALKKYESVVRQYFGTLVSFADNKFASLNTAVWSGGSFVYIPSGVKLALPLQAYFRINAVSFGQFERTLIIADEGAEGHYIEGCTAPIYTTSSLHASVVEVFVKKCARVRYTTIQNWSDNVYNLVTKRATVSKRGNMEWVDCNIGSCATMKYPSVFLTGEGSHGEVLSIAYAQNGQHQDAGAKIIHLAPHTSSRIRSKSISRGCGRTSYRGYIHVVPRASHAKVFVSCDALIVDNNSRTDTYPSMDIHADNVAVHHEATVTKIQEEQLVYLISRGIRRSTAEGLLVNGFVEPITRELPFEYAIELNRLLQLEMEASVG